MEINDSSPTFFRLESREDVASILGIEDRSLRYFLFKRRPENMYHTFQMEKRNGTFRTIAAPEKPLMEIQRKLASILSDVYMPKACAYGFVKGKSIVDNAKNHTGKRFVFNIDLKDFFNQIHFGRICGLLQKEPYSIGREAAITIAQICCLNGRLPQGAPSSPVITNMICASLDNELMRLAKQKKCFYTRYADDITFSTYKREIGKEIGFVDNYGCHVGETLASILKKHTFEVNQQKISLSPASFRQEVTGLTVNCFPNLRRTYLKELRAILHSSGKYGLYKAAQKYISKGLCKNKSIVYAAKQTNMEGIIVDWFKKVLIGKILYIQQVRGLHDYTYLAFAKKANDVLGKNQFDVSDLYIEESRLNNSIFILEGEYGEDIIQASAFYLRDYGLLTSYHVTKNPNVKFKAYTCNQYDNTSAFSITKSMFELSSDINIDYALYQIPSSQIPENTFPIGKSDKLTVGDKITLISCADPQRGATPSKQNCEITRSKTLLNAPFFTVSGRIIHGSSGGLVLNEKHEAIGLIKGGVASTAEVDLCENQGFVPLHLIIDHITEQRKQKNKSSFI